ncbi:hypothetical protein IF1G_01065 [Cordyceps javanica]|uniref:Uncharacterized protein n=1 Tax=Cordyceps javanica TaxID=43265 RepID=A0A545VHE3_9HYPO|nr:hypothetical protein IF1G_01065 [Cordyceps javanica]
MKIVWLFFGHLHFALCSLPLFFLPFLCIVPSCHHLSLLYLSRPPRGALHHRVHNYLHQSHQQRNETLEERQQPAPTGEKMHLTVGRPLETSSTTRLAASLNWPLLATAMTFRSINHGLSPDKSQ